VRSRKLFGLLFVVFLANSLWAFEVNTHQAITRCAVSLPVKGSIYNECFRKDSALNLHYFAKSANLDKEGYSSEIFEGYGVPYREYAKTGIGFGKWHIVIPDGSYSKMIEAGAVLEDAVYSKILSNEAVGSGEGRFNNHFYHAQGDISQSECEKKINKELGYPGRLVAKYYDLPIEASYRLTERTLCNGATHRTDNISWALDKSVVLYDSNGDESVARVNHYNLDSAFKYYRQSFVGTKKDRHTAQAKLFVTLGFLIHLIQDLHSPAHVRDGSHSGGDYLEIYGRYNGGFNLRDGSMNINNNLLIEDAIANIDMKETMLKNNKYSSYQDFYTHEANWVGYNFMSEAHDFDFSENGKLWFPKDNLEDPDGSGLELDEDQFGEKFTTIFDKDNKHLSRGEVSEEEIPNSYPAANAVEYTSDGKWYYLNTKGNVASEKGAITYPTVALRYTGYFGRIFKQRKSMETMAMVTDGSDIRSYSNYNKVALSDTATNVMARAVVSSEAFINYFFRARIEATLDGDSLVIKNVSDPQWVSSPDLCTLKEGMDINISFVNKQNSIVSLMNKQTLDKDVAIGKSFTITGMQSAVASHQDEMKEPVEIIVLVDGQIGELKGLDDYNIKARGLSVTYAKIVNLGGGTDTGGGTDNGNDGDNADNGDNNNDDNATDGSGNGDNNDNNTTDPTKDPNKVCVSNFFKYYGDGKIHDSLKRGDKDAELYSDGNKHQVKELQEFLEAFGYDVGSSGADGWFGRDTENALIEFQSTNGLDADGIVGPQTKGAMNNTNCYDK